MSKYLKCTTDKSPISYKCGEKIVFKIEAKNNCQPVVYDYIKWSVRGDDGKFKTDTFKFCNHEPLIIETSLDRPGYVRLTATVHTRDSAIDQSFDVLEAGAGADIDKLEYCDTIPEDFDIYWADIEKMVADHTPEVIYEREITENVPNGFKAFDIRLTVPCDGRPASGIITYPDDGKEYPLQLIYNGYSVAPANPYYNKDYICFNINAHGIENELPRVMIETKYNELSGYGFNISENSSNMTTYWRNVMIRDLVGAKYGKSLSIWDKKGMVVYGGSQGAFQAVTVAAHDKDVTFLDIFIPWFCNLGAENRGFMGGWRPKFAEGLRYFDTVAQATRVKCPVKIGARLGDYVCPPSTTTTLYNSFSGVKSIDFSQSETHSYRHPELDLFRLRYDPENPEGKIFLGKYRHYKGGEYEVIGIGTDSETSEDTVIYKSLENGRIWVRPKWMFEEYVNVKGLPVKRFEYLG